MKLDSVCEPPLLADFVHSTLRLFFDPKRTSRFSGSGHLTLEGWHRRAHRNEAQDGVARRHQPPCDDTDGINAAPGRAGAATATASDPLSWGAGAECETAKGGGAGTADGERTRTHARRRWRPNAGRERKGAHALGAIVEARVRYRHRALPALWWATEAYRGYRRTSRHRPRPHPSGTGRAAATACVGGAGGSV